MDGNFLKIIEIRLLVDPAKKAKKIQKNKAQIPT